MKGDYEEGIKAVRGMAPQDNEPSTLGEVAVGAGKLLVKIAMLEEQNRQLACDFIASVVDQAGQSR